MNFLKIGTSGNMEEKAEGIIGEVRMFISTSIPSNFLLLDGSAYNTTTYSELYSILGSGTLPDFRDRFVRAWGTSRTPNTTQDEELKSHTHTFDGTTDAENHSHAQYGHPTNDGGTEELKAMAIRNNANWIIKSTEASTVDLDFSGTTDSEGGTETRPQNISVVFAICAR